jgi:hypothetical protein
MSHIDLNPYAIVALVLLVCAYVATWPAGRARLRRYDLARARRARRSEDAAWRRRAEEAEVARVLWLARYDQARSLGGHSLAIPRDPDTGRVISGWGIDHDRSHPEFELGLGEIDGGGE